MAASHFTELLGSTLNKDSKQEVQTSDALSGAEVVGIYFSAHWCPPCRKFTPRLVETYNTLLEEDKKFKMVFCSADQDEASFKDYFGEMDNFLAIPWGADKIKAKLNRMFDVEGIPSLVLLDGATGLAYNTDARGDLSEDPMGSKYPWKPPTLEEALGQVVVDGKGNEVPVADVMKKPFGLYFSAHWCPPCKAFTPQFAKTYKKIKDDGKDFEVIFVSSDRDEKSFNEYFGEMPWLALPFADRERKAQLSKLFGVQGIPSLVICDAGGEVITKTGRASVMNDEEGKEFPWHPKPVNSLEEPEGINKLPSLILFMEGADDAKKDELSSLLEALAERNKPAAKGEAQKMLFFTAKSEGRVANQIRKMCGLGEEYTKPTGVLLDIPDEGGFYVMEEEPEATAMANFVHSFQIGKLSDSRKQLARM